MEVGGAGKKEGISGSGSRQERLTRSIWSKHIIYMYECVIMKRRKEKERKERQVRKYSRSSTGIFLCTILVFHLRANKVSEHTLFRV